MDDIGQKILAEFFGFLQYKVEHGGFTFEEEQAMLRVFENSIRVSATADDLAGYYGKTPTAVRAVISRKMLSKPTRKVLHSFNEFRRVVPEKWKK